MDNSCIDKSTELIKNNNIKFKYVTTFIIGTGSNLSVGAPYCRDCPNITYAIREPNQREKMASLLPEDIQSLSQIHTINNYQEFIIKYPFLDRAIQAKMLGANADQNLINILYNLKNKVQQNIQQNELNDFEKKWNPYIIWQMVKFIKLLHLMKLQQQKKNNLFPPTNINFISSKSLSKSRFI